MTPTIGWCLACLAFALPAAAIAAEVNPESARIAAHIPIADLHMHPEAGRFSAVVSRVLMDRNGVGWAGAGVKTGGRAARAYHAEKLGDRFIAFAGQSELTAIYKAGGIKAMLDAKNPGIQELSAAVEEDLKAGRIKGVGEIHINNRRSSSKDWFKRKGRTDAPSMRLFYALVASHGGFLTFHMEGDSDSVNQLEALLASDRRGHVLLNHCGVYAGAGTVRSLLQRNPNLFCEISVRYPPVLKQSWKSYDDRKMFDSKGVEPDWLKLIEDYPDRFMIGTDTGDGSDYDEAITTVRGGLLPYLRPATARMVAHENARRLFGLK